MLFLLMFLDLFLTEEKVISGRVTNLSGDPLIGVGVVLQDGEVGLLTGKTGNYELIVPEGRGELLFSFPGYADKVISLDNQEKIDVVLEPAESQTCLISLKE